MPFAPISFLAIVLALLLLFFACETVLRSPDANPPSYTIYGSHNISACQLNCGEITETTFAFSVSYNISNSFLLLLVRHLLLEAMHLFLVANIVDSILCSKGLKGKSVGWRPSTRTHRL